MHIHVNIVLQCNLVLFLQHETTNLSKDIISLAKYLQ
jgi:hypothetical protein